MYVLNAAQMREEEKRGFEAGISYEQMMRRAGENAAMIISEHAGDFSRVCVVCGKGNNGGDGLVAAKKLYRMGKKVSVVLVYGRPRGGLPEKMFLECLRWGIVMYDLAKTRKECIRRISGADLLIDAVFGIGFNGDLSDEAAFVADIYNKSGAVKAAMDIPSGLCADNVNIPEKYFHADFTVTMHAPKPVNVLAKPACGDVYIAPIGFDCEPEEHAFCVAVDEDVRSCFAPRKAASHKGSYGFALSVCGSRNMPGAAVLAARAAAETGTGLTAAAFPDAAYVPITAKLTEQIFIPCASDGEGRFAKTAVKDLEPYLDRTTAALFGCGAGKCDGSAAVLEYLLKNISAPLIIDADGLNILAQQPEILDSAACPVLLTPHPAEMGRLTGMSAAQVNADRIGIARGFAEKHGVNVLLKGSKTVIASPDGEVYINLSGNPGMAVGGSGDMLSGVILSFAAQGMSLFDAAVCGAYIHGLAGDIAAERYSMAGTTPTRMLECMPEALGRFEPGIA